jgi:hypothetical protein
MNRGRLLGTVGQEILQRKGGAAGADRDDRSRRFSLSYFCFYSDASAFPMDGGQL